jgi:hypothetical protein
MRLCAWPPSDSIAKIPGIAKIENQTPETQRKGGHRGVEDCERRAVEENKLNNEEQPRDPVLSLYLLLLSRS